MTTFILDGIWGTHSRWELLRHRIEVGMGPCRIWRYNSTGWLPLETLGAQLAGELRALDGPFCAVGYSMGGLVIREAMRQMPRLALHRAAFLHSPHQGSMLAHLLPLSACRDMRPGSAFLQRLNATPWPYPTLATWCPADLMVFPGRSACWQHAAQVVRSDMPLHPWPVISPGIHKRVVSFFQGE